MLELATEALRMWCQRGEPFVVATVVSVTGSAPRRPGAALAVDAAGTAVGSVSGGCVEGTVYELCRQVLADGQAVLQHFGYSDESAFSVGLTCGGSLGVFVQRIAPAEQPEVAAALAAAAEGRQVALARVISGPDQVLGRALLVRPDGTTEGSLGNSELQRSAHGQALALLQAGRTTTTDLRCGSEPVTLLVEASATAPRLLVFGAIDFAAAVTKVGVLLGYQVTVCDARPVFATRARFAQAHEVIVDWPHRYLRSTTTDARTVVCVLTHDPKFDLPLLATALRMPLAYVGAMGSRRTHEERLQRLTSMGLTEEETSRLYSPIGLDLGARTPEETAVSIFAEVIAERNGATGLPLRDSHMPIHRDRSHAQSPF